jgi:hypothetical protein
MALVVENNLSSWVSALNLLRKNKIRTIVLSLADALEH